MDQNRLERLLKVGRSIVSELDLDALLEHILGVARDLTGARYAAVGVLDDERKGLSRFVTSGIDAETRARIGDLPHGRGVLGKLIADPRPLRLDEVGMHPSRTAFPWVTRRCTRSWACRSSCTVGRGGTSTSPRRPAAASTTRTRRRCWSSPTGRRWPW
jgi:signal transduction protein with GAF and PtsI domain